MSLIFCLLVLIGAISFSIVAFLIVSSGDLGKFKNTYRPRPRNTILPFITRYGDVIASPQELDNQLSGLKTRLREKYQQFESFKIKVQTQMENIQKYQNFKKGYTEMQANMIRIEDECNELQHKVEYFKKVQMRVQEELSPDAGFIGDALNHLTMM